MSTPPAKDSSVLGEVHPDWGKTDPAHMGYASEDERKARRGLEDWELVERMPDSQRAVPYWFLAVVLVVLLIGIGLAFPFWGVRPGYEKPWLDWGFVIALVYIAVAGYFVYFMVTMYTAKDEKSSEEGPQ
jgi:hypothetical protein